jgi:hypothetical protein
MAKELEVQVRSATAKITAQGGQAIAAWQKGGPVWRAPILAPGTLTKATGRRKKHHKRQEV